MIEHGLLDCIRKSQQIAIFTHVMPDGDALGASLALGQTLQQIGKTVDYYCENDVPPLYAFLSGIHAFKKPLDVEKSHDLSIAVDCSDGSRLGRGLTIFKQSPETINIDHHISNTRYAMINWVVPEASAAGELIYALILALGQTPDKAAAEALYTAISTDTGSFNYSSTTPHTHRIAADLIALGIDVDTISTRLFRTLTLEKIRLLSISLGTLEIMSNGQVAMMTVTRKMLTDCGATDSDTENLVNYAKDIYGVELGILLKETEDGYTKMSFRSKEKINAAALAGEFGGGGHKKAAGANIDQGLKTAREALIKSLQLHFKEL